MGNRERRPDYGVYVFVRRAEIDAGFGPKGEFDAAHLKAIHRHLFQDVYEWAGRTRDEPVTLSDGTVATEPGLRKVEGYQKRR
jgi:cell filamentation protein